MQYTLEDKKKQLEEHKKEFMGMNYNKMPLLKDIKMMAYWNIEYRQFCKNRKDNCFNNEFSCIKCNNGRL